MRRDTTVRPSAILLALLLSIGAAHPEATLRSSRGEVPAGGSLPLSGEKFTGGESVRLVLRGALDEYDLRAVRPAEDGTFALDVEVPGTVRPGSYRLVAVAGDGDVVATLEVSVVQALAGEHASAIEETVDLSKQGTGPVAHATAEEMPIERSRAGLEWGLIGLLVGLAGAIGLSLVLHAERF